MNFYNKITDYIRTNIIDDEFRVRFQLVFVLAVFSVVSGFMTILNIITNKNSLMISTLVCCLTCVLGLLIGVKYKENGYKIAGVMFVIVMFILFQFFIITGIPQGFSVLWIFLIPPASLFLFGKDKGSIISLAGFLCLIFYYHTPLGLSLLKYNYTTSFKTRSIFLYIAFYLLSYSRESIRLVTHQQLTKMQKKYKYFYTHDALTGIYNRYGFDNIMNKTFIKKDKKADNLFMIIDIDNFKRVNDNYGHLVGDVVLKEISSIISKEVDNNGFVSRWGGEEFAVLITDIKDFINAYERTEGFRKKVEESIIKVDKNSLSLTVSIGAVYVPSCDNVWIEDIVGRADSLLYQAKDRGKNQIAIKKVNEV